MRFFRSTISISVSLFNAASIIFYYITYCTSDEWKRASRICTAVSISWKGFYQSRLIFLMCCLFISHCIVSPRGTRCIIKTEFVSDISFNGFAPGIFPGQLESHIQPRKHRIIIWILQVQVDATQNSLQNFRDDSKSSLSKSGLGHSAKTT